MKADWTIFALSLLASATLSASAHAITYVETTDLPSQAGLGANPVSVGTISSTEKNIISGSLSGSCERPIPSFPAFITCDGSPSLQDTEDSFYFTVTDQLKAFGLSVESSNYPPGFGLEFTVLQTGLTTSVAPGGVRALPANLGPGTYQAIVRGGQATSTGPFSATYKFYLGGVPEPSTWALMIMGIGLAGAIMRRRPVESLRHS